MRGFREVALVWCAIAGPGLPAAAQSAPAADQAHLAKLVVAVQDADYRGDLARLRAIAAEMKPYTTPSTLAPVARYWRGFAHWRHALNSLNDGAPPDSADRDFAAAVAEFREALAIDSADIESQIGLAAGLGNRAYFNRQAPEVAAGFLAELGPLTEKIRRTAPENPRMVFVVSAGLFWAPRDRGGDREQALAMLERGIRLAASAPPGTDPLAPSWGEAELHMLLGWFSLNLAPPDVAGALGHAEAALLLRPRWRYVRENLLPQIRRRSGRAHPTTLAYRVHHMPAMFAFYRDAFGVEFREVDTGGGLRSQFGALGGLTLKFVPIREGADFEDFPIHQLGLEVPDMDVVLAAVRRHGGRVQDAPRRREGRLRAAVRDPDGNTLELYGP
ncbi:MAG TPA: VOC family protein [Gemmatimonadales bacterium]|nr:VOC family protein [Gemmatimonadales bacterium]